MSNAEVVYWAADSYVAAGDLNGKVTTRLAISLVVLLAASLFGWLLRLSAKRNSSGVQILEWEDAILWVDWIINATVAFSILAIKGVAANSSHNNVGENSVQSDITPLSIGLLVGIIVAVTLIIPNYLRWYGTDSSGNYHKYRGILASNLMALAVVVVAVSAGASFF